MARFVCRLHRAYFRLASQRGPLPGHQFDQSRRNFAAADLAHVLVNDFVEIRGSYVERFQLLETVGIVLCIRQARNTDFLVYFMRKIDVYIQLLPSSVSNADTMIFPPTSFGRIARISAL
jgi:hypothetical protein